MTTTTGTDREALCAAISDLAEAQAYAARTRAAWRHALDTGRPHGRIDKLDEAAADKVGRAEWLLAKLLVDDPTQVLALAERIGEAAASGRARANADLAALNGGAT